MMRIAALPRSQWSRYARLTQSVPGLLPCQGLAWFEMLGSVVGGGQGILAAYEGEELVAALPYAISEDGGLGRVLNSLPFFGSHGGVAALPGFFGVAAPLLLAELDRLAQAEHCVSATVVLSPFTPELELCRQAFVPDMEDGRIGQLTPLPDRPERLFDIFSPCKRNNVRRALAQGVHAIESNSQEGLDWVHAMHSKRMDNIGGLAKPQAFFDWAAKCLNTGELRLLLALEGDSPCAGLLLSELNDVTEYLLPATDWDKRQFKGIQLLVHQAMHDAVLRSKKWFNFGGTWGTQNNLYEFKKRFGAVDMPYTYLIRLYDKSLPQQTKEVLSAAFPFYFALPFDQLNTSEKAEGNA
ncbi:peptidoglycan bridge formation glycyltransferase FemA/FemB family protein [Humidesulfovibrio sp.]